MRSLLLRRGWRESFPFAGGLWFWLGFRGFLGFFLAFVFASHAKKCDTKIYPAKVKITLKPVARKETPFALSPYNGRTNCFLSSPCFKIQPALSPFGGSLVFSST